MIKAIPDVRDEILKKCAGTPVDLETVSSVFKGLTIIDEIIYVEYDTPATNPIWGAFTRWSRQPSVYAASETFVEVRYASHLSEPWRRFIICKELCHALDGDEGSHSVTRNQMNGLVQAFVLRSVQGVIQNMPAVMFSELAAEACAIEIMFPIKNRKEIIASGRQIDAAAIKEIAAEYNMPDSSVSTALDANYIQAIDWLFENR